MASAAESASDTHVCDLCAKEVDAEVEDALAVSCVARCHAPKEFNVFHADCIKKYLRSFCRGMDVSRGSGYGCPYGRSGRSLAKACPGKVSHSNKIIIKNLKPAVHQDEAAVPDNRADAARPAHLGRRRQGKGGGGGDSTAAAPVKAHKKPARMPEPYLPTEYVRVTPAPERPRSDPLGRNAAAAAAAAAASSKAAKKNQARRAARQRRAQGEEGAEEEGEEDAAGTEADSAAAGDGEQQNMAEEEEVWEEWPGGGEGDSGDELVSARSTGGSNNVWAGVHDDGVDGSGFADAWESAHRLSSDASALTWATAEDVSSSTPNSGRADPAAAAAAAFGGNGISEGAFVSSAQQQAPAAQAPTAPEFAPAPPKLQISMWDYAATAAGFGAPTAGDVGGGGGGDNAAHLQTQAQYHQQQQQSALAPVTPTAVAADVGGARSYAPAPLQQYYPQQPPTGPQNWQPAPAAAPPAPASNGGAFGSYIQSAPPAAVPAATAVPATAGGYLQGIPAPSAVMQQWWPPHSAAPTPSVVPPTAAGATNTTAGGGGGLMVPAPMSYAPAGYTAPMGVSAAAMAPVTHPQQQQQQPAALPFYSGSAQLQAATTVAAATGGMSNVTAVPAAHAQQQQQQQQPALPFYISNAQPKAATTLTTATGGVSNMAAAPPFYQAAAVYTPIAPASVPAAAPTGTALNTNNSNTTSTSGVRYVPPHKRGSTGAGTQQYYQQSATGMSVAAREGAPSSAYPYTYNANNNSSSGTVPAPAPAPAAPANWQAPAQQQQQQQLYKGVGATTASYHPGAAFNAVTMQCAYGGGGGNNTGFAAVYPPAPAAAAAQGGEGGGRGDGEDSLEDLMQLLGV